MDKHNLKFRLPLRVALLFLVGVLLGASALYIALKLGFVFGVSLLTILFMRALNVPLGFLKGNNQLQQDQYVYFLSFTTGMSYSSITVLSTVLAALLLSGAMPDSVWGLILWLLCLNAMGTVLAWVFRNQWKETPFPSAQAAARLIQNSEDAQRPFWFSFLGASVWVSLGEWFRWVPKSLFGVSLSPLFIGLGGILGIGTAASFFLGGFLFFGPWELWKDGSLDPAWFSVSGILTFVFLDFSSELSLRKRASSLFMQNRAWFVLAVFGAAGAFVGHFLFHIPIWIMGLTLLLTVVLSYIASKVTGETDVTPLGALGKLTLLLFSFFAPASMLMPLAGQVVGPAAASADFASDLKCGSLLDCQPRRQLLFQSVGAFLGPFIFLPLFLKFGDQIGSSMFPAPAAQIWNQFQEMLVQDWTQLAGSIQLSALLGAALALFGWFVKRGFWNKMPTLIPFFMAYYLDFGTTNAIFLGGCLGAFLGRNGVIKKDNLLWSGLLSGEAILMVLFLFF